MADNDTLSTTSSATNPSVSVNASVNANINNATMVMATVSARSFEENMKFIVKDCQLPYLYHIEIGFVPGMKVNASIAR